jgi:GMP synthase-like glutamine amidotransferase
MTKVSSEAKATRQSNEQPDRPLIGILACDHVTDDDLLSAAEGMDYDAMYTALLKRAEPEINVKIYDVVNGELPERPDECDGWIITGARYDAYSDEPWITALRHFVAEIHQHNARLAGVCFGHQIVAHALGGEAGPAGEWKAGPQEMTVEPTPWFEGGTVWLNAMHRDVAHTLPPQAKPIAAGTTAEHPAYLVGDTIFCVQDHPEFNRRYTAAIIDARRERMGNDTADAAAKTVMEVDTDGDVVGRWIVDFLLDHRLGDAGQV